MKVMVVLLLLNVLKCDFVVCVRFSEGSVCVVDMCMGWVIWKLCCCVVVKEGVLLVGSLLWLCRCGFVVCLLDV